MKNTASGCSSSVAFIFCQVAGYVNENESDSYVWVALLVTVDEVLLDPVKKIPQTTIKVIINIAPIISFFSFTMG